jgi:hypothetical protein
MLTLPVTIFGAIWLFSPWLYLGGLRAESARLVQAPAANAASRLGQTSRQIVVSFTTSRDLAAYRKRWRLPFIQAGIFACKDSSLGTNDEVATQGAGYFSDEGRVRALGGGAGPAAGRYAYQATFGDELTSIVDHEAKRLPAATCRAVFASGSTAQPCSRAACDRPPFRSPSRAVDPSHRSIRDSAGARRLRYAVGQRFFGARVQIYQQCNKTCGV